MASGRLRFHLDLQAIWWRATVPVTLITLPNLRDAAAGD